MRVIMQHEAKDCGAACLSMIAEHYGLKLSLSKFCELTKTDHSGTNLYGLVDGAKKIGLNAEALSGSADELIQEIENGEVTCPFIAHIISDSSMLHYVVVVAFHKNKFIIADPAKGKCKLSAQDFFKLWTGYIVVFQKTEQFQAGNNRIHSTWKFLGLLRGQYRNLAGAMLLSFLIAVIGIMGAFVFEIVIDDFAVVEGYYEYESEDGHEHDAEEEDDDTEASVVTQALEKLIDVLNEFTELIPVSSFNLIFLAVICLYLLEGIIQFIRGYLIVLISKKVDIRLTLAYYNQIMSLPISSVSVRQTGEYLSRFSEADKIRSAISEGILTLVLDAVMVIACGIILVMENQKLFFVSLIIVLLYAAILLIYRKPLEHANRDMMEQDAVVQSYFKESISGIESIKANCADLNVKNVAASKFYRFVDSVLHNNLLSISQETIAGTVELVGTVIVLWIGFAMVLTKQTSIGSLMTFYVLVSYFSEPIKNMIELQPTIQSAFVAADRLNDILELQKEDLNGNKSEVFPSINQVELRHVNFRYGNQERTLEDVDLVFSQGEKIAIVGETGSGKTTIAKLLLRFYEIESGEILLNGENIQKIPIADLRKSIAYVEQNTFLFADTIKNNLLLGNQSATDEEISCVCKMTRADQFINKLPLGYHTPLDENGSNLSGGQRQRIAIARALLRKPRLLIMDEATSNLDAITENEIKETIIEKNNSMTCIFITHRLTTVKNCDRIYVMENGHIVESGTHDELICMGGKYTELWNNK